MNQEDLRIDEYFDSAVMPFGMKITHLPTNLHVQGNCKHETSKMNMQRTLMDTLAIFVGQAEGKQDAGTKRKVQADNEALRIEVAELREMVRQLVGKSPVTRASTPAPAKPKRRGKSKGWSEERRQAASERMRERQAKKKADTPLGAKTEEELLREQMRPPTDAPQRLPKAHQSHGSVVAVVSPESQARGYRP